MAHVCADVNEVHQLAGEHGEVNDRPRQTNARCQDRALDGLVLVEVEVPQHASNCEVATLVGHQTMSRFQRHHLEAWRSSGMLPLSYHTCAHE